MSQEKKVFKTEWAGRSLTIETGQLAKQANGAVSDSFTHLTLPTTPYV